MVILQKISRFYMMKTASFCGARTSVVLFIILIQVVVYKELLKIPASDAKQKASFIGPDDLKTTYCILETKNSNKDKLKKNNELFKKNLSGVSLLLIIVYVLSSTCFAKMSNIQWTFLYIIIIIISPW